MPDPADQQTDEYGFPLSGQPPLVAPPAMVAPSSAPAPVAAPGVAAVRPPPGFDPAMLERIATSRAMSVDPAAMAHAEEAVAAAMRFQAMRAYQKDMAGGMAPAEALQKHAPSLFVNPKTSLGQVSAFLRTVRPPAPKPPVIRAPSANDPDVILYRNTMKALDEVEKGIREDPADKTLLQRRSDLAGVAAGLNFKIKQGTAVAPPASPAAAQGGRVKVRSKEGKVGSVPASQLESALAAGYTRAE